MGQQLALERAALLAKLLANLHVYVEGSCSADLKARREWWESAGWTGRKTEGQQEGNGGGMLGAWGWGRFRKEEAKQHLGSSARFPTAHSSHVVRPRPAAPPAGRVCAAHAAGPALAARHGVPAAALRPHKPAAAAPLAGALWAPGGRCVVEKGRGWVLCCGGWLADLPGSRLLVHVAKPAGCSWPLLRQSKGM